MEKEDRSSYEYKKKDPTVLSKKVSAVRIRPSIIMERLLAIKARINKFLYDQVINYLSIQIEILARMLGGNFICSDIFIP